MKYPKFMKKQVRDFELGISLDWLYGVEISKIKKDLEDIEAMGGTHVEIDYGTFYDVVSIEIKAISRREETDEEMNIRIREQQAREEESKQRELAQLAHLKAKYGE